MQQRIVKLFRLSHIFQVPQKGTKSFFILRRNAHRRNGSHLMTSSRSSDSSSSRKSPESKLPKNGGEKGRLLPILGSKVIVLSVTCLSEERTFVRRDLDLSCLTGLD